MSARVDFSNAASTYDGRHGAFIPAEAAQALARHALLRPGSRVLDVAAGTGRVAIPLTSLGCRVIAIDIARPMLDEIPKKTPSLAIPRVVAEGARLPFAPASVDAVVIARLLYLEKRERALTARNAHKDRRTPRTRDL